MDKITTGELNSDLPFRHLPGFEIRSIALLGEGLDHHAWLVNSGIVVRQAREWDPAAIEREAAVLHIVGEQTDLPVPRIVFSDPEEGLLAHRFIPGLPLLDLREVDVAGIARQLGACLGVIHDIPLAVIDGIVPLENEPLQEWLDEAREMYPEVAVHLPVADRRRIEAFLDAPPPPDPEQFAFCHNDFGAEHILVDPGSMRVTGIIDWSDAAITDPVRDLALILRDLGPAALDAALSAYGGALTPDDLQRLVFHARCKLIEDLAYGIETGSRRYVDAALAHLDWTFGAT